jgi:hypothetical protein
MGKPKLQEGPKGKTAARYKQVEKPVPCVRVPEHKAIRVDFRPEVGRAVKAMGCETCKIVWKATVQGLPTILAENMVIPGGRT